MSIADKRLELQSILLNALDPAGILKNVYYQAPENFKMEYPAIVYRRSNITLDHADGVVYSQKVAYEITLIDARPDSPIIERILKIQYCYHNRHYVADGLHHDVFIIYY